MQPLTKLFGGAGAVFAASAFAFGQSEPVVLQGHGKAVTAIGWAPDGATLATASDDRSIRTWDATTGRQLHLLPGICREGYGGPAVAFRADLRAAAVNHWGEIAIRNLADGRTLLSIDPLLDRGQRSAFRPDVFALAFHPDGRRLATAGSTAAVGGRHGLPGGVVIVWDAETGKIVHRSERLSTAPGAVVWNADGTAYAAATNGAGGELPEPGEVLVWNAATGERTRAFRVRPDVEPGDWASAADVAFSSDGGLIAAAVASGSRSAPAGLVVPPSQAPLRAWSLATGADTPLLQSSAPACSLLTFSPQGELVATADRDHRVRIWPLNSDQPLLSVRCPHSVLVLRFSPDGKALAAGGADGAVRIWSIPGAP